MRDSEIGNPLSSALLPPRYADQNSLLEILVLDFTSDTSILRNTALLPLKLLFLSLVHVIVLCVIVIGVV